MLRRLLIAIFVLASLTSQASVAFACGMMGGAPVVLKHCCCEHGAAAPGCNESAGGKDCCQTIIEISAGPGDQVGGIAAPVKLPTYDPHILSPVLLPALLAITLPVQSHAPTWDETGDPGLYGTDLYLRTQRLRL